MHQQRTAELYLYEPHEAQLKFHDSEARFRVAAFGRQSGKSTACLNEILKQAWENPGTTYWYVSPTFDQARVQYRRLIGMLWACPDVLYKKNQTELRIKLINQSQVRFVSGETLQNLRGETLHGCVVDEVREQHADLWPMVIRPMLTVTKGWCAFVSTPNGFDQFYDLYERARSKAQDWEAFQSPSNCNPLFTSDEMEAARREMSEPLFAQEIMAEFRDLTSGKTYANHGEHNHRMFSPFCRDNGQISPHLPIIIGCDFNVNPIAWLLGQERMSSFYFFDEIFIENTNTQEACQELIARLKKWCPDGHKPGVTIIGDATGNASKTSAAGQTDYSTMLRELTLAFGASFPTNDTPDSNPLVKDRVNVVNARLRAADGSVNLWYHPGNCKRLRRDFERVTWKQGTSAILDQKKDPLLTHISDAAGYVVHRLSSQLWAESPGILRVLQR